MQIVIDIPEEVYKSIQDNDYCGISNADMYNAVKNGTLLEEIPNPCIECSQNCCVSDLNGEKCSCQKIYVLKEKGWGEE